MKICKNILLICDLKGGEGEVYAITTEGSGSQLVFKFTKPDYGVDESNLTPNELCVDSSVRQSTDTDDNID